MVNLLLLIWTATALSLPSSGQSLPTEKLLTLDNGLRVFLVQRDSVPLVNIVAAVNAGSKDETEATSGLTHLLEHYILFRGTDFRTGGEVAREIRSHGAVFNAHTGQDLATFEISLPTEHFEFGLENQKEILFNLKIEEAELSAEKEVILEEIKQIEDDPFRYGGSLIYQNLMLNHPYGRPVYGRPETIGGLSREDMERFYRRLFVPNNAALAIVGNLPIAEMEARVRAVFGPVPRGEPPPVPPERPRPLGKAVEIVKELDVDEAYLIIGVQGPDYNDPKQYAADVLTQVLGQGINPMLAVALKGGRRNLVNSAQMTYIALKRAGAFVAYLTLDPKNLAAAKREAVAFLKKAWTENFSPSDIPSEEKNFAYDHLEGAKNSLRFLVQQAWESGLGLAASMAMHLLLNDKETKIDYLDRIATLQSSHLREAASGSFSKNEFVFVSFVPRKK
jgi:predicted Zn-dependent peptidase